MIFGFIKKLVKYYIDKLIHWMRMTKFNLELNNEIKKYHEELDLGQDILVTIEYSSPRTG